jgi:hypothetical protein
MIHKLKSIVTANGILLIRVENKEIIITSDQNEIKLPLVIEDQPPEWDTLNLSHKNSKWIITSDMYDVFEEGVSIQELDSSVVVDVLIRMLEKSIQYIAKIILEEGVAVLIVNSYNDKNKHLLSTIGLLEDIRIIFAVIKRKE